MDNEGLPKNPSRGKDSQRVPYTVRLEAGKDYYYCSCGLTKNQPFCDGSHMGSKFTPIKVEGKGADVFLCGCRQSLDAHGMGVQFCDGTHAKIDW